MDIADILRRDRPGMAVNSGWDMIWKENVYSLYHPPDRHRLIRLLLTHGFEIAESPRHQLTFSQPGIFVATMQYEHRTGKPDDVHLRVSAPGHKIDQIGNWLSRIIDDYIPGKVHMRDLPAYWAKLRKYGMMP